MNNRFIIPFLRQFATSRFCQGGHRLVCSDNISTKQQLGAAIQWHNAGDKSRIGFELTGASNTGKQIHSIRTFCNQHEQLEFEVGNEDDFDELVLHSEKPVLVSFYADWCGPCQNLAPRLSAKVTGQQGKILLARINVEEGAGIAEQFDIKAVPTIVCFKEGEQIHRFEGDVDDAYLDQVMANLMLKDEGLYKNTAGRVVPEGEEKDKIF